MIVGGYLELMTYRVFQAISVAVLVAGTGSAVMLSKALLIRQRDEIRHTAQAEAGHIASQLQTGVLDSLEPLRQLGSWWLTQGQPLAREDWVTDGQLFLSRSPGLQRAEWVDAQGVEHWSAAPGGAPVPGTRRPDDRVSRLLGVARFRASAAISDPFDLSRNRLGFVACVPVFQGRRLRGFLVGTYDAHILIASIARGAIRPDHRVSISWDGRTIFSRTGGGTSWAEEMVQANSDVLNQVWAITLRVPLNAFRAFKGQFLSIVSVIGALLYSFAMLLLIARRRSQELNRQKTELETEVARRLTSEAEVLALNHELTRKIADFKTLLDVIPIGIVVAEDPECRVVRPNPALAAILGIAPGTNLCDAGAAGPFRLLREGAELPPEKFPMRVAAATKAPALGEEVQLEAAGGTIVDALSFAAPVIDGEGRVSGVINAFVDITERKSQERTRRELEQRLQRSERMQSLGVMAAGIAHDFNNLLAGVIGQASLAAQLISDPVKAQGHIESSLAAAERAAGLIKKVLAYTGQSHHLPRRTDLAELVRKSESSLRQLAANKTELQFHVAERAPAVLADSKELRRALQNVVLNALEAAEPAPGRIEIGVDSAELGAGETNVVGRSEGLQPGRYAWIEVKDSGAGMSPEVAEKAFDPFFTTKFLGRGLGLAEVLGIMRSHGGAVQLKTAQGAGTSVRLLLPAESGTCLQG